MRNFTKILFAVLITSCSSSRNSEIKPERNQIDSVQVLHLDTCVEISDTGFYFLEEEPLALEKKPIDIKEPSQSNDKKAIKQKPVNPQGQKVSTNKNGQLMYSIEDTMKLGINYKVVVRILNGKNRTEITSDVKSSAVVEDIKTSSTMEVEMVDPDKAFNITSGNSQIQVVDSLEYTEWIFIVKPVLSGSHPLTITSSIIQENGKKEKTYSKDIFVRSNVVVSVKGFWATYWQWLFSTIIIPFVIWLYRNKKSKDAS
jgi:hypothetical protein